MSMTRLGAHLVFSVFVFVHWPYNSKAQAPQVEAREAFERGERAFEVGDYELALSEFRRAFTLAPHDAVRFNIAVCLDRLARYDEALHQYEAAASSEELSSSERLRAQHLAEQTRSKLGPIEQGETAGDQSRGKTPDAASSTRVNLHVPRTGGSQASPEPKRKGTGVLTWTGVAVATAGTAGILGFGLRTRSLHQDYEMEPTSDRRDQGLTMRALTNASIGVAAVGIVLIALDQFVFARRKEKKTLSRNTLVWTPGLSGR